jgi:integrase
MPEPRFGKSFSQSSTKQQRLAKIESGKRDLTPVAIKAILEKCSVHLRPLVLLAINGAFGASDLGGLTLSDYNGEWIDYARRKTGVERRVWLWPETRIAIDAYLKKRKTPYSQTIEQVLFLTGQRQLWMRGEHDAIGKAFQKAREAAELDRGSFYDLRRTFQTIAEGCLDFPAVSHVMGHAAGSGDMSAKYRQRITDERIKAVCQHVRNWLFGGEA